MRSYRPMAAAIATSVVMCTGGVTVAQSASASTTPAQEIRPATTSEIANALRANGAEALLDSEGQFDRKAAANTFGETFAARFDERLHSDVNRTQPQPSGYTYSKDGYVACVLKGVGLGGLVGASTAIANAVANHAWKKAAELLIKEAAKRGMKIAVKGGVVGLAGALGGYAIWCATPWS